MPVTNEVAAPLPWRLILNPSASSGVDNMALDEAIMLAHAADVVPPTLRFYRWSPPAISLGYFQDADDVDFDACAAEGVDVVRRPTGGRAILHEHEWTYSAVIRTDLCPGGTAIMTSYTYLSRGLMAALQSLGLDAYMANERPAPAPAAELGAACFSKASRCDIVVEGRKVIGSAQVRQNRTILQHGSIPLRLDSSRLDRMVPGSAQVQEAAAGLQELVADCTCEVVLSALVKGFATAFEVPLTETGLTPQELSTAAQIAAAKYGNTAWTRRNPRQKTR